MNSEPNAKDRSGQAGFTLVEVLVSVVVLSFGLMAIANLFAMSTSSNVAARHMTAAASQATEVAETLKAVPFSGLTPGGPSNAIAALDTPAAGSHQWTSSQSIRVDVDGDNIVDAYEADRIVDNVGTFRVRWQIAQIDQQTVLIHVVAASASPLLSARSRVELLSYRTCTGPQIGCPETP
jgi:prepilin-type N-terminal cleavage/methylation domain-containing protein